MSDARAIRIDYVLPHPPTKVWRALTDRTLLGRWLMPNDLAPVVGHRFTFQAKPMPGWDGVVHCEVLEVDPPRRLVYAWRGGSDDLNDYGSRLDTVVTWTLESSATGTLLRLEHSGFTDKNAFAFDVMGKGWGGKIGEQLRVVLTEQP
jgi:uncharacterized protein YndB with AHSA1/START domain